MTTPRLLSNRYEIGETLGYGGMSEVHRGRDVRLGREVAVKVLRADLARDPQFQERFRREAQNAAALNHPAIVAVYDTGETRTDGGPLPYIVMEYVDGRTLRDIVKGEGPLPGQRAMEIMADVCAALDFSHRHGIVHRDVKPANVMITRTGAVKVMDFGIARAVADGQVAVTQTSAVIGTAQYLSPEQARGESVDARSDVYATGCVLFELLTGEPPFTGDSPVAVAYQHVREDPRPPSALNPRVNPQLDAIVLKAMSKGAANRYQSAAEMRTDLVRVLSGQRPAAPMVMTDEDRTAVMGANSRQPDPRGRHRPEALADDYDDYDQYDDEDEQRRKRRKNWMIALVSLLVLALVGIVIWLLTKGKPAPSGGESFSMPSVVGEPEIPAKSKLTQAGLTVTTEAVPCQPKPDGTDGECGPDKIGKVLSTTPAEGTSVKKGDPVTLRVGAAPGKVPVPDLAGKTRDEAIAQLQAAQLQAAPTISEEPVDDATKIGKVTGQDPAAGQQATAGSMVKLTIGKAPDPIEVPNLIGQDFETAQKNLTDNGFKVKRVDVASDKPAGQVIDQTPKSGKLKPNSTVSLSVSNGQEVKFPMPDIDDRTPAEAEQMLKALGWTGQLSIQEFETRNPNEVGKISDPQFQPGEMVAKNQTIGVRVGKLRSGIPTIPTGPPN